MKKSIRILALVLALLMVACVALTGCGKGGDGDKKTEVNKDEWKELTLNYWSLGPGEQDLDAVVEEAANEILAKDLPNTKVHWTWIPAAEIKDKVTRAFAADEEMDLVWLGWMWSKIDKHNMAKEETIVPMDTDICADYLKYIGELERKAISVEGKDYFFIGWQGIAYGRHGWWFSTQLVKEAMKFTTDAEVEAWRDEAEKLAYASYKPGERTAETEKKILDFFEKYAQGLEDTGYYKDDAAVGNSIDVNIPQQLQSFRGGYGYYEVGAAAADAGSLFYFELGTDITKDGFELKISAERPIVKQAYEHAAKYFTKGWIRPDKALIINDEAGAAKSKYHKDVIAGGVNNPDYYKGYKFNTHNMLDEREAHEEREGAKNGNIDVTAVYVKPTYALDPGWSTMSAIPYTAEKKEGAVERAMYFSNWLFKDESTDYYRTVVYGREGKDKEWYWNEDGKTVTWNMGVGSQGDASWKYGKASWYWSTTLHALDTGAGGLPMSYYQKLKDAESNMYADPFMDFSVTMDAEMDAIASNLGAITKEYTTMLSNGYLGDGWEAKYNEYVQKLKDNKIDVLKEKVQKQIVDFAKANNITTGWADNY